MYNYSIGSITVKIYTRWLLLSLSYTTLGGTGGNSLRHVGHSNF